MLVLTRDQVRRVDQLAVERYKIPSLILMENAGRNAAAIIDRAYGPHGSAFIVCGTGNNGGDGCVIARHLHNLGWRTRVVVLGDESKMSPDMRANCKIVAAMDLETRVTADTAVQLEAVRSIGAKDVVIDAILGTGFRGRLRVDLEQVIDAINAAPKRAAVALDVPSGLDCDTGQTGGTAIRADLTISFVAAKPAFTLPQAAPYVGRLEIADIGAPRELIDLVAAEANPDPCGPRL